MTKLRQDRSMDRRSFLRMGSVAAFAAVGGFAPFAAGGELSAPAYRTLGRTGLKVSVVGLGAMRTSEPAVMQATFDRGVNYVDTARSYMGGNNEHIVGQALKGYRDKVFVATKFKLDSKAKMIESVEQSLSRLETDYVDVIQLHQLDSREKVMHEEAREVLAQLKKGGKARFVGVTTHRNEVEVIDAVISDPERFFDVVLVVYNFKSSAELKAAIARAAKKDVGIIAMKTQAGGYETKELGEVSPHQAALKWVLQDEYVTLAIPSMVDLAQVQEDTAVLRMMRLTEADVAVLRRYGEAIAPYYCHLCGDCLGTCPRGVDIHEVNRSLMYAQGYSDVALARATYRSIPNARSASACVDCSKCVAQCVNGLDISSKMKQARTLFA